MTERMISQQQVLDALREGGWKVEDRGRESRAQCPAHNGDDLNLAVGRTDRGGALVYCHSQGCDAKDIFKALGLRGGVKGKGREPVRTHAYKRADGMVSFTKTKYVTYRDGVWGYEWGTEYPNGPVKDDDKPLYNLRGVLAERELVVITEGEKDADTLIKAGYVATCSDAGAGSWRPQYNDQLAHVAEVVIVADNDKPGIEGAQKVRARLGRQATILVPPNGYKDIAEMYAGGFTYGDLEPLAEPESTVAGSQLKIVNWDSFFEAEYDHAEWEVEPIMLTGRMTNFHAPAGEGKSEMALYFVARSVVEKGRRILWLDREMNEGDVQERLEAMGFRGKDLSGLLYSFYPIMPPLDTPEGGEILAREAAVHRADGIVLDSLSKFLEGDENDNETHTRMWNNTTLRLREQGTALTVIDHTGKDTEREARGGAAKKDNSDLYMRLKRNNLGTEIKVSKKRHSWIADRYTLQRTTNPTIAYEIVGSADLPHGHHAIVKMLDDHNIPLEDGKRPARQKLIAAGETPGRDEWLLQAINFRRARDGWKPPRGKAECVFCGREATHKAELANERTGGTKQQPVCDDCKVAPQRRAA